MNFNNIENNITKEFILSKIDIQTLWRYYSNFTEIDKSFKSNLYNDTNASCRVVISNSNNLYYKDYGCSEHYFQDVFSYIMYKYSCNYYECLNIICSDFKLRDSVQVDKKVKELILELGQTQGHNVQVPLIKQKSITIVSQNWNLVDYKYWNQYGISFDLLNSYDVFSAKYVYLVKGDKRNVFSYSKVNPCYAYRFCTNNEYHYKIYFPLSKDKKFKWLFSGGSQDDIEGLDQLPLTNDILILGKSLKDCMVYNLLGYPCISLQGETNKLSSDLVYKLLKRFDKIIVNYDGDSEGIKGSKRLNQQYGFKYFFIDNHKDVSDGVKSIGLEKMKEEVNEKIKNLAY